MNTMTTKCDKCGRPSVLLQGKNQYCAFCYKVQRNIAIKNAYNTTKDKYEKPTSAVR